MVQIEDSMSVSKVATELAISDLSDDVLVNVVTAHERTAVNFWECVLRRALEIRQQQQS